MKTNKTITKTNSDKRSKFSLEHHRGHGNGASNSDEPEEKFIRALLLLLFLCTQTHTPHDMK